MPGYVSTDTTGRLAGASAALVSPYVMVPPTLDPGRPISARRWWPARVMAWGAAISFLGAWPGSVRAAEVTRVVSGFEEGRRFDVAVTLTWSHDWKLSLIHI